MKPRLTTSSIYNHNVNITQAIAVKTMVLVIIPKYEPKCSSHLSNVKKRHHFTSKGLESKPRKVELCSGKDNYVSEPFGRFVEHVYSNAMFHPSL